VALPKSSLTAKSSSWFFDKFFPFGFCASLCGLSTGFRQFGADMFVEISQHRQSNLLRIVAGREKRNLHQPRLDGLDQAEVGNNPFEKRVGFVARTSQIIRRGAEVVDAAHFETLSDTNESAEPHSGTAVFFCCILAFGFHL